MDSESTDLFLDSPDSKQNRYKMPDNIIGMSNELIQSFRDHEISDKKSTKECFDTLEKIEIQIKKRFEKMNSFKASISKKIEELEEIIRGSNFHEKSEKLNQLKSDKDKIETKITSLKIKLKNCQGELEQKNKNVEHLEKILTKTKEENYLEDYDRLFLYRKILKSKITHVGGKLKMFVFDKKNKRIVGVDIDEEQDERLTIRKNLNFFTKH
eukprot:GAHX01001789.1.p1 GENE.GAHX01001789.1~~GAHX01001789.1.p1  ORF type:complete len:212 (-),score=41.04 GAHX01001789.1:87-722(-)